MAKVVLSIGSNIEPKAANLQEAYLKLSRLAKTKPKSSSVYITQPHGFDSENEFLNQAIFMETGFSPEDMLDNILQIEKSMGRVRNAKETSDRTIDIDILFYNNEVINKKNLVVPHPRLHERNFVLTPLLDIIPDYIHPVLKKSIWELYDECKDMSEVRINE